MLNACPVKLGTPYHEDPSYIEYFVQFTNTNNLEDCSFSLESLSVVSSKLEIFAENVRVSFLRIRNANKCFI